MTKFSIKKITPAIVIIITGIVIYQFSNSSTYEKSEKALLIAQKTSQELALDLALQMIQKYPDEHVPYHIAANIYTANRDYNTAEKYLQLAIRNARQAPLLYTRLAYFYKNIMPEKLTGFTHSIIKQKISATFPALPARLHLISNDIESAQKYMEQQLCNPNPPHELYYMLSRLYRQQNRPNQARKILYKIDNTRISQLQKKKLLTSILSFSIPLDREGVLASLNLITETTSDFQTYTDLRAYIYENITKVMAADPQRHCAGLLQNALGNQTNKQIWLLTSAIYLQKLGSTETAYILLKEQPFANKYLLEEKALLASKLKKDIHEIKANWQQLLAVSDNDSRLIIHYGQILNNANLYKESNAVLQQLKDKNINPDRYLHYLATVLDNTAALRDYRSLAAVWNEADGHINFDRYDVLKNIIFSKLPETEQHHRLLSEVRSQRPLIFSARASSYLLEAFLAEQLRDFPAYFNAADNYLSKSGPGTETILFFTRTAVQKSREKTRTKPDKNNKQNPAQVTFAHKWLKNLLKKIPDDPGLLADLLITERIMGIQTDIEGCCGKILAGRGNDPNALHLVADTLMRADYPQRALHFFEKAVRLRPDIVRFKVNRAACFMHLQRYDEAIEEYTEILTQRNTTRPWNTGAILNNLWAAHDKAGTPEKFIALINNLKNHPAIDRYEFYKTGSMLLYRNNHAVKAIALLEEFSRTTTDKIQLYNIRLRLAQLYALQKRYSDSIQLYKKNIRLFKHDQIKTIDSRYNIGEIKRRQGRFHEAIAEWEKLTASFPGSSEAVKSLLHAAEVAQKDLSDTRRAVRLYRAFLKLSNGESENILFAKSKIAKLEQAI